jgi:hypothetical protein
MTTALSVLEKSVGRDRNRDFPRFWLHEMRQRINAAEDDSDKDGNNREEP